MIHKDALHSGREKQGKILKNVEQTLVLAARAVMGSAAGEQDAADGRAAAAAGLAGALIDAVLDLEEAAIAVGVDVVGDRGAAETDGVPENGAESPAKAFELGSGEAAGAPAGPDSSVEEALVGIDVAHAGEEGLVEESGLDGELAAIKKSSKRSAADGERVGAGREKAGSHGEVAQLEAAEAAWVDEAQLAAAGEGEAGVGVRGDGRIGGGDEKAAGHAQVDDPLGVDFGRNGTRIFLQRRAQLADDVLAGAVDGDDEAAGERGGLDGGRRLEGLGMRGEPGVNDAVAVDAPVDAAGNGFHLGQFGHEVILRLAMGCSLAVFLLVLHRRCRPAGDETVPHPSDVFVFVRWVGVRRIHLLFCCTCIFVSYQRWIEAG